MNGGQTYTVSGIKYNAVRQNGNKSLCLRDGDGNDCNATVNIGTRQRESNALVLELITSTALFCKQTHRNHFAMIHHVLHIGLLLTLYHLL